MKSFSENWCFEMKLVQENVLKFISIFNVIFIQKLCRNKFEDDKHFYSQCYTAAYINTILKTTENLTAFLEKEDYIDLKEGICAFMQLSKSKSQVVAQLKLIIFKFITTAKKQQISVNFTKHMFLLENKQISDSTLASNIHHS